MRLPLLLFSVPLLAGSVFGCSRAGVTTAATPIPEQLVAEGSIIAVDNGVDEDVVLPITIRGHAMTAILDLGSANDLLDQEMISSVNASVSADNSDASGARYIDSLVVGTVTEQHVPADLTIFTHSSPYEPPSPGLPPIPGLPPVVGYLGVPMLSRYDVVLDGPARQVRLYAPPRDTTIAHAWLPPGVTPADCMPILALDGLKDLVGLHLQVNGHALTGFFDSGAKYNVMNLAAARVLGVTEKTPHVREDSISKSFPLMGGERKKSFTWSDVDIVMGSQHILHQEVSLLTNFPLAVEQPILNLGLNAVRDRVLFVSWHTRQVCLGGSKP